MKLINKVLALLLVITVSLFAANLGTASAAYADGEYDLPFTVLKGDSDEASMTNDYLMSPAKLIVKDGVNQVQLTLKNSSWWKDFQIDAQNYQVLSDSNDTRVVQFDVSNLDKIINAKLHVVVPDIDYDNKYDVRFSFDTSNLPGGKGKTAEVDKTPSPNAKTDQTNNSDGGKETDKESNPPTGDETPILLFTMTLLLSAVFLVRKLAIK